MALLDDAICPNCDAHHSGAYCPTCGQKRPAVSDLSASRFIADVFEAVTNTESKLLRTLRALLLAPGRLTLDYFQGKRQRYLKPVQLFVACNVWFFLMQSVTGFNTFTTPLGVQLNGLPYSPLVKATVFRIYSASGLSEQVFASKFNAISADLAKTLIFVMLPLFALILLPLLWKRGFSYGQHLIFAAHLYSFLLVVMPLVQLFGRLMTMRQLDVIVAVAVGVYGFLAVRRTYGFRSLTSVGLTVLVLIDLGLVVMAYRFLLLVASLISMPRP
ncbi:MAG: DUF3667 domain-containing protein [Fimbriimonas sp.]